MKKQTQLIPARMAITRVRYPHDAEMLRRYGWKEMTSSPMSIGGDVRGYRVLCGFGHTWGTGHPCPGKLGEAFPLLWGTTELKEQLEQAHYRHTHYRKGVSPAALDALAEAGSWYLEHPERLRRDDDGVYRIMSDILQGRLPLPSELRQPPPIIPELAVPSKDMVGDLAVLPLTIECPRCHRLNRVTLPDDAAALNRE